jgi:hypothetical protein
LQKCQSVLPDPQFRKSASFVRAPVLPECQFCQSASFARAPVLPEPQLQERQFCQSGIAVFIIIIIIIII